MAKRRAPKPPPFDAQRAAAGAANWKLGARGIEISDHPLLETDIDLLEHWLLKYHPEAAEIARRGRGKPPIWASRLQDVRWLRKNGVETVSDAPGSRCVKLLGKLLDAQYQKKKKEREHGERDAQCQEKKEERPHGERDSTAESRAGVLRAILDTIKPG